MTRQRFESFMWRVCDRYRRVQRSRQSGLQERPVHQQHGLLQVSVSGWIQPDAGRQELRR